MSEKTTIKSIAEVLEISPSTVSRALNGKPGLSKILRERIKTKAREMQYHPNTRAQALVKGRVGVVGVIIPRSTRFVFSTPLYSKILMGIGSELQKRGHHILLFFSNKDKNSYAAIHQEGLVDGVIIIAHRLDDQNIKTLEKNNVPTVLIPGYMREGSSPYPDIGEDDDIGVLHATEHLISLNHRRIAFLVGSHQSKYTRKRLAGFRKAMQKNGFEIDPRDIMVTDFTEESGYKQMTERFSITPHPTAVIGINDNVTLGAIHAIHRRNMRIPNDISVITIGGTENVQNFTPRLTTLKIPMVDTGKAAAKTLMKVLDGVKIRKKSIVLKTELILSESTGPAPQQVQKFIKLGNNHFTKS